MLAWLARPAPGQPFRTQLFLAVLALATAAVTLRLNLLFTARVHPAMLAGAPVATRLDGLPARKPESPCSCSVPRRCIAEARPVLAAVLVSLAIVMLASLAVIEPATARGASLDT